MKDISQEVQNYLKENQISLEGLSKKRAKKIINKISRKIKWKKSKENQDQNDNEQQWQQRQQKKIKKTKDSSLKLNKWEQREQLSKLLNNNPKVMIDYSYEREQTLQKFLGIKKQIQDCHSQQFKSKNPLNLYVTNLQQNIIDFIENSDMKNWLVKYSLNSEIDFENDKVIYLTPDAEEEMQEYQQDHVYIIGGMIDWNAQKNASLQKSKQLNVKAQKFPIDKYVKMKAAPVLSINQSFNILLKLFNGENWDQILKEEIPQRKVNYFYSDKNN